MKKREVMEDIKLAEISKGRRAVANTAQRVLSTIGGDANLREARAGTSEVAVEISKMLNGQRAPLRLDAGENLVGVVLNREYIRGPIEHAFSEPREYTLFGRVEKKIEPGNEWDPIDTIRSIAALSENGLDTGALREGILTFAKEQEIKIDTEHERISGPAIIVYPIAVYW